MSKKEIGSITEIAQELVDHLPEEINTELTDLLAHAEEGRDITVDIVDLFARHEATRLWLKEQIDARSQEKGTLVYSPLAGNPSVVSLRQKWVCPKRTCDYWMLVIQEGEDPPLCRVHKIEMVQKRR